MQQSSDNNLCTIVLLAALGYLIYCLLKNNNTNTNTNEEFTNNYEKPSDVNNVNNDKNIKFENGLNNNEYIVNDNINKSVNLDAVKEMPTTTSNKSKQAVVDSITTTNKAVNNFKSFDDDYTPFTKLDGNADDYGISVDYSDLNNAFGPLANTQDTLDLVKMNHSEMKNYNSKDFLPQEVIKDSFEDVSQAKYNVDDNNLINTDRYVVGINTVGQSLKNGSHDIRGTIPNPKFTVSPWNNSTYEPDYNIKPLC